MALRLIEKILIPRNLFSLHFHVLLQLDFDAARRAESFDIEFCHIWKMKLFHVYFSNTFSRGIVDDTQHRGRRSSRAATQIRDQGVEISQNICNIPGLRRKYMTRILSCKKSVKHCLRKDENFQSDKILHTGDKYVRRKNLCVRVRTKIYANLWKTYPPRRAAGRRNTLILE